MGGRSYRSDLSAPKAKALYSYAEFRLLAGENRWEEAIASLRRAVVFDPASQYLRMGLAKALLHKDQAEESIQLLRSIIAQTPDNVEGLELLGDLLSYQEQHAEAVEHYQQALQLEPGNEMLRMRLAMGLGRLDRHAEAIGLLEELVKEQPEAKLAHLSLARFYLEAGQQDKAQSTFQTLLAHHPDHQQALIEYGKLLEEEELFAEAFALYRQGIERNPRAIAVRQQLAALYLAQKRYPEALEQLLAVRQLVPGNLQLLWQIGLLRLELEDWAAAETDLQQLFQSGDTSGRNRYYLGLSLIGQQKYRQAIEMMTPIEESSPIFTEAVLQLAYLFRQSGQSAEAISALEKVLAAEVYRPEIYYYLAAFLDDSGEQEKAAEAVNAGLVHFPQNVELLYQAAVLAEKQGDRPGALELMAKVLEVDVDNADALNFIAYHYAEKGTNLELALSRVQQALTTSRSGYIIDTLGWIYFKMGRYHESREQLEEATSLLPDDPVILEHLGDLYNTLTLWEKAAEVYRRALEFDPLAEGVAEKLNSLQLRLTP